MVSIDAIISEYFTSHPVPLATVVEVLKLPGTEAGWRSSYKEVVEMLGRKGVEEMVWWLVQILGAPGTQEQWGQVVGLVKDQISTLKAFLLY